MEVRHDHALAGQPVQGWCGDFAAHESKIRKAEIVGHNDQKVGSLWFTQVGRAGLPEAAAQPTQTQGER